MTSYTLHLIGLQQLMAGARRFNTTCRNRDNLCTLTEEAAKISGIPYVRDRLTVTTHTVVTSIDHFVPIVLTGLRRL